MNAYKRKLRLIDIDRGWIDYYTIADLYNFGSIIGHSIKKLLVAGSRNGGKSKLQDLKEAYNQLGRAIEELEKEFTDPDWLIRKRIGEAKLDKWASERESDIEMEVEKNRDDDQGKVATDFSNLTDAEMDKVSDSLVDKPLLLSKIAPKEATHYRVSGDGIDFYSLNCGTWLGLGSGVWEEIQEGSEEFIIRDLIEII